MVWYDIIAIVWYDMVLYGIVYYGMVCCGMVWYSMHRHVVWLWFWTLLPVRVPDESYFNAADLLGEVVVETEHTVWESCFICVCFIVHDLFRLSV